MGSIAYSDKAFGSKPVDLWFCSVDLTPIQLIS